MPQTRKTSTLRSMYVAAAVVAMALLAYVGWTWMDGLVVQRIIVEGSVHAEEATVLEITRVDSGGRLLDVDPVVIADRAARHPWVREADVHRRPPGTVTIQVKERQPVALALGRTGSLAGYVDEDGYVMPLTGDTVYDVPLVHGLALPENATRPVDAPSVRALLKALGGAPGSVNALLSSFEVQPDGDVTLHTAPAGTQSSVRVQLGKTDFADKFERLNAFWTQAVLSRPDVAFETIDLRFDSQIVTRES